VLRQQGEAKIDGLIDATLGKLGDRPALADQVRCAALLSAMMRDLSRMKYKPKNPAYEPAVRKVMRIFDAGAAEEIEIGKRAEAADLLGQVGDPRLEEDTWVVIPAGSFHMGAQKWKKRLPNCDQEAYDSEEPVREVQLRGFRIGRFPVTVQEFGDFMKKGGSAARKSWAGEHGTFSQPREWQRQKQFPNRSVTGVSWFEAAAYCAWAGGRLPTEAEWERAARGAKSSRYPWGNEPPLDSSRANYNRVVEHATPVGLFPKGNSSEGLCDILGNVWEWCGDWFGPYEINHLPNPSGPKEGEARILRGGSWLNSHRYVRASSRNWSKPANRSNNIGFRCAGELS
jgi:formylglycine-generating enzyme required for sulfatase activity